VAAVAELPGLEAVLVNCCCPQVGGWVGRTGGRSDGWAVGRADGPGRGELMKEASAPPAGCLRLLRAIACHCHWPEKQLCAGRAPAALQAVTAALPVLAAAAPPGVRVGGYANGFKTTTSGGWVALMAAVGICRVISGLVLMRRVAGRIGKLQGGWVWNCMGTMSCAIYS